ncbi:MAG: molybdopterin synthase sulfur carrier subunit [Rhodobacteraceae bacterium]|jgi:molybdopterin synthase sulfur carrier subunit|nr:molybdopterin synthase sulfur carrier subunit [Paracoccaceae bacterium]MEC7194356.1 MoaD/ThiS family protein [Pseudomonadota bacterium]|tara:strand:- start:678 stop:935 length:258 start_codon:yes stop_codon:yes gene_type:complete
MGKVKLKYFSRIREAIGKPSELLEIKSNNLLDLIEELQSMGEQYSVLKGRDFVVYSAVDQNMVTDLKTSIEGATEIAFFPPMTGG